MPITTTRFTKQELADWRRYERVRLSGEFNMWFPQAREATGLSPERYFFVLRNYEALRDAQKAKRARTPSPFEDEANGKERA